MNGVQYGSWKSYINEISPTQKKRKEQKRKEIKEATKQ